MPTTYTSLLGLALPASGELTGTWGTTVNDSITELVEDSIAATATASVAAANWTLTTTGSGVANEARCAILIPTGAPGVSRNIVAPSQSKAYVVINQSDAAVVLKGAATTGAIVAVGARALCAWNGADFVVVATQGGAMEATQVDLLAQGALRMQDAAGGQYAALRAPVTVAASYTLTMPGADGVDNQVLTTNGAGALSFGTPSTTNVTEGTNLYYTNARWLAHTTTDLAEGTSLYYTDARARAALSGTAPVNYTAATGVIALNTVPVANGGTGVTASGASGNVLTSNGAGWVSSAPAASGISTGKAIAMAMIFGF